MTKSAVIYRRISRSAEESTSLAGQAEAGDAYAKARGWVVVRTYTDDGISGGKAAAARPGLAALLADAAAGRFEVVIIAKLDRLARSLVVWNETRATLAADGVDIVSVAEGLDLTTPAGRMVANVLASFAEFERERIGERIREAGDRMAREGRHFASPVPFGWRSVPRPEGAGLRLALHDEDAPYLRSVIERVLEGSITVGGAVTEAETEGRAFLSATGLRRLLRNPVLLGYKVHRGQVITGDDGLPLVAHDPIVTPSEFRALNEAIERNRLGTPRPASGELRLLNALRVVFCADCGRPLPLQRRKGDRDVYACRRGHVSADAERLEEAIEEGFLGVAGRAEVVREEVAGDPLAGETLQAALGRRDELAALVADGLMPAAVARDHLERLGATIERLEREVSTGAGVRWTSTGETFADAWAASDIEGRRSLLASSGVTVSVARAGRGRRPPMAERLEWSWPS